MFASSTKVSILSSLPMNARLAPPAILCMAHGFMHVLFIPTRQPRLRCHLRGLHLFFTQHWSLIWSLDWTSFDPFILIACIASWSFCVIMVLAFTLVHGCLDLLPIIR